METIIRILLWFVYIISLYFAIFWFLVLVDDGLIPFKQRKIRKWPLTTIAIPVYNCADRGLKESIDSVMQLDYPKDKLEVLVINHGSTDDTPRVLSELEKKYPGRITRYDIGRDKSDMKGIPLNFALEKAKGEFFVTLDADSVVDKETLKKLLTYFTADDIGAVMPLMKVWKTETFLHKLQWYEFLVNMFYKKLMSKLDCVHIAPGPFTAYRTKLLRDLGGYDGHDLTDDFEMSLKIQQAHYRLIQTLDCCVYSNLPGTFKKMYNQRNRWFLGTINNLKKYKHLIFNKKYGDFGLIQMPTVAMSAILATIIVSTFIYYTLKPYFRGLIDMANVNFDFITLLKNISLNIHLLDFNYVNIFIMVVMSIITITIFMYAHRHAKERPTKMGWAVLPVFFLFYFLMLGIAWIGALFDSIRRRKREW